MRRMIARALTSFTLVAATPLLPAPAAGADWPMLGRDATRNPASPEKGPPAWWQLAHRDEAGTEHPARNVRWRADLGTYAAGDPVVSGGLVWVGTNNRRPRDPKDKALAGVLMCFREADGRFLYQHVTRAPAGSHLADLNWTGHTSSPLAVGDRVWFTTALAEVMCLDVGPLRRGEGPP